MTKENKHTPFYPIIKIVQKWSREQDPEEQVKFLSNDMLGMVQICLEEERRLKIKNETIDELLEALERIVWANDHRTNIWDSRFINECKAAIAKARGEE